MNNNNELFCCNRKFKTKKSFDNHKTKHKDETVTLITKEKEKTTAKASKHTCPICSTSFSSLFTLKVHKQTNCSTDKNYECSACQKRFLTIHLLNVHLEIHKNSKKFLCSYCSKRFLSKGQLKVHERKHNGETPFICNVCGKGFGYRESLVTHVTIHTGVKPYTCQCCDSRFSCVGNLIKHKKIRPDSCGLPIYKITKVCKRAGVKCKGKIPKVIVESSINEYETVPEEVIGKEKEESPIYILTPLEVVCEQQSENITIDDDNITINDPNIDPTDIPVHEQTEELYYETEIIESIDAFQNFKQINTELIEVKEMKLYDYVNIEIKNMEDAEKAQEAECQQQNKEKFEIENVEYMRQEIIEHVECYEDDNIDECIEYETNHENEEILEYKSYIEKILDKYHCKICPKAYLNLNISIKHLKSVHNILITNYNYEDANRSRKPLKTPKHKCKFCARKYTSLILLKKHESVHGTNGELIHKCVCCPSYFEKKSQLDNHQNAEHKDRLECIECKKKFNHPEKLVNHIKYKHQSEKKFKVKKYSFVCSICGRNFNTKMSLSDHERSDCGKKPLYRCEFCDKFYHSAGSLKTHSSIHTLEMKYECTSCDKTFRTNGQLTVHVRTHSGVKPFKCEYSNCTSSFAHRESLITHSSIHTGVKKWGCSSCGSRFSCIGNLLAHKRTHKKTCEKAKIIKSQSEVI